MVAVLRATREGVLCFSRQNAAMIRTGRIVSFERSFHESSDAWRGFHVQAKSSSIERK